jgi:hypothetical protein
MKQIYDIVTKKIISLEKGKLISQSSELGFDYSSLQRLFSGKLAHLLGRYILPENKDKLIILVNFETNEEYDCVGCSSMSYYSRRPLSENDSKYFHALVSGRQTSASICGLIVFLKGRPKTKRFVNMKLTGHKYQQKIIEQKLQNKLSSRLRSRIKNALRSNKKNKTRELIGCNIDFLMGYLEKQFQNGMSWENYGKWHIDHIRPLSSFDLTNPEDQIKACHYSNLQPLWAEDNLRKSDKLSLNASEAAPPQNI